MLCKTVIESEFVTVRKAKVGRVISYTTYEYISGNM